ncbi:PTS sugar transporter subunit IIB [Enterococcus hulanensis]|uniref:PTS sugar transporter subunit IIB n=1 Tax=Enterococcus hulanensis TaxID=2559929 RepID=A0ABU3EZ60_9ENTE|nr:PTS sugar transporter subunit IIB [Enterococcus hulanensis]MDT2600163.1 PTS sugar transporter subunit IIB [Enterococcus hulanensis]MDT2608976.1 PTS sugar transporter subunit IIB [Enterococcus hulanensis]MDT2616982.1 PTS sugar transporter subunit IIB [Enterococcus hulanensis]MDT2628498.1 PTS sugar transporter subunit IIB [Enterococcus hulanensis]MDT2655838.1 PTS sugar transporter subunit IIB [Enterococcus hulanensis]
MEEIKVMLVCGGGASSGFLASSMRKAAKKKGIVMDIFARSEGDIDNYKNEIDVLLLGPHLRYLLDEATEKIAGTNVKLSVIENDIYGSLDGARAVNKVLQMLEE